MTLTDPNISDPAGVAMGPDGRHLGGQLRKEFRLRLPAGGGSAEVIISNTIGSLFNCPRGIAFDSAGNLWVANVRRRRRALSERTKFKPPTIRPRGRDADAAQWREPALRNRPRRTRQRLGVLLCRLIGVSVRRKWEQCDGDTGVHAHALHRELD